MGFRIWKRVRLAPGIRLNISKSGASFSLGGRGFWLTLGGSGTRVSAGLPGTGLYWSTKVSARRKRRPRGAVPPVAPRPAPLRLPLLRRLFLPSGERHVLEGCAALSAGDRDGALAHFLRADCADGFCLAGFLCLERGDLGAAEHCLLRALEGSAELKRVLSRHGISVILSLNVAEGVDIELEPDVRGVLLALVEVSQRLGKAGSSLEYLRRLLSLHPSDMAARLSMAEVLVEDLSPEEADLEEVLRLTDEVTGETPLESALLLFRAKALRRMGLPVAAMEAASQGLRRKKGRPPELVKALRYEKALALEEMGRGSEARRELERIFAEDPGYEDVAERLGRPGCAGESSEIEKRPGEGRGDGPQRGFRQDGP